MTDVTVNPLATPEPGPQRSSDGTLLNQQTIPPTPTDSSSTPPSPEPKEPPKDPASTDPKDDKSTILNKKDGDKAPTGAPEKYEDFKLPEGLKLEPKALEAATAVFKDLNLDQAGAQRLVDFHAEQLKAAIDGPFKTVVDLKSSWETELKSTYGKDIEPGGKLNVQIGRFIDSMPAKVASEFREAMDLTLAGSNPAFVAAMKWVSEQLAEGAPVKGNGPSPLGQKGPDVKPRSVATAMYPHLPSSADQR
jgi:hypothetical protein